MKKNKIYVITIVVLLILNLIQLSIPFIMKGPPRGMKKNFDAVGILHLNDDQKEKFKQLAKEHHQKMVAIQEHQKTVLEKYFNTSSDLLLEEIKDLETQKIALTNTHFNEVKTILKKEQVPYFQEFKNKAVHIIIN